MTMPFCVYVLRSDHDGNLYVGFTTNLDERLKRHSKGWMPFNGADTWTRDCSPRSGSV